MLKCPNCRSMNVSLRNIGFVNCKWILKGEYKKGGSMKSDGQTFDNSLYTFKEIDYRSEYQTLDITTGKFAKKSI